MPRAGLRSRANPSRKTARQGELPSKFLTWKGPTKKVEKPVKRKRMSAVSDERLAKIRATKVVEPVIFDTREIIDPSTGELSLVEDILEMISFADRCAFPVKVSLRSESDLANSEWLRDNLRWRGPMPTSEDIAVACRKCDACIRARHKMWVARALREARMQKLFSLEIRTMTVTFNSAHRSHVLDCLAGRYHGWKGYDEVEPFDEPIVRLIRAIARSDGRYGADLLNRFRELHPAEFGRLHLPYAVKDFQAAKERLQHREKKGVKTRFRYLNAWEVHPGKKTSTAKAGWMHGHCALFFNAPPGAPGRPDREQIKSSFWGYSKPQLVDLNDDAEVTRNLLYSLKYLLKDGGKIHASPGFGRDDFPLDHGGKTIFVDDVAAFARRIGLGPDVCSDQLQSIVTSAAQAKADKREADWYRRRGLLPPDEQTTKTLQILHETLGVSS